jgi:glycosyltransferase involved in cell wall biosynthesis
MTNPLVTIITPCYNGEAFLDKYFASILAQTYDRLELIFVNDGSTDRTEEIAQSYRQALEDRGIVFKYLYQPNGGQAKAMNTGFREMTGKYLVWPDSDDLLSPDSIEKRAAFLDAHPEYGFVRSNGDFFSFETGKRTGPLSYLDNSFHEDIFLDLILEETYCACGCYMVRTELLREIYPDLTIYETPVGQNWQILIPIAGRSKCGYIDEELYHVAVRTNSHSRQSRTLQEEVDRRMGLKKVLEMGIALSGRTDRDYQKIVDLKYQRILMRIYLNAGAAEEAEACYRTLKQEGALIAADHLRYLEVLHPVRYRFFLCRELGRRAVRKGIRLLTGK